MSRAIDDDLYQPDTPLAIATTQMARAIATLRRPASDYLRFPWASVDEIVGGMAGGQVWFLCAYSGIGKTTFLVNAIGHWLAAGKRIGVMPLESTADDFRLLLAANAVGADAGTILSGNAAASNDAPTLDRVERELKRFAGNADLADRLRIDETDFVDLDALTRHVEDAADFGADVVIVDHIDHLQARGQSSAFEASRAICQQSLRLAQRHGVTILFASQLNNQVLAAGNHLSKYAPPQPQAVYWGGVKRQIATGMLGLFRPIRALRPSESPEEYKQALDAAKSGQADEQTMLTPNTIGVSVMKSRNLGRFEGRKALLRYEGGRLTDLPVQEFGRVNV